MEDISPELLEKLRAAFKSNLEADEKGKQLLEAIAKGATYEQAGDYAECVGNALAKAFRDNLSSAVLPDGKMYWNITEHVLTPLLKEDYQIVSKVATQVQKALNTAAGIGIQPQVPDFDTDRVTGIANRLATTQTFEDVAWILQEPIVNFSRAVVDETMKKNADFLSKTGGKQYVTRKVVGSCCEWCSKLEGTYNYPDKVPPDFFRRHQRCRCVIDGNYEKKKTSKKVSKKPDGETKSKIKKAGLLGEDKRRPTVDISGNGGIIKSGGISGALESSSKEAKEHAVQYYTSVRKMKNDVIAISKNTGFSVEDITSIKNFVFLQKHDLGGDTPEYFVPSYDMAQTWQRLIDGKNIQKHDLTLLKHESLEKELISQGKKQEEAHLIASAKYNYSMEVREYNDKIAKNSKK